MIDITNEVFTKLKTDIPTAKLLTSFQSTVTTFPQIVFTSISNVTDIDTIDNNGEYAVEQSFDVNIFTKGRGKLKKAQQLANDVDSIMGGFYNMNRIFSDTVPNYLDASIYRYTLRYNCKITKNNVIYRR